MQALLNKYKQANANANAQQLTETQINALQAQALHALATSMQQVHSSYNTAYSTALSVFTQCVTINNTLLQYTLVNASAQHITAVANISTCISVARTNATRTLVNEILHSNANCTVHNTTFTAQNTTFEAVYNALLFEAKTLV